MQCNQSILKWILLPETNYQKLQPRGKEDSNW